MKILFNKYEGTGNDFIIINNINKLINKNDNKLIEFLCDRRFGIGADGLILAEESKAYDCEMIFFNSDGFPARMCGNGGRCFADYVMKNLTGRKPVNFIAADGPHTALPAGNMIDLSINDVNGIHATEHGYFLNTGVPHLVCFRDDIEALNIIQEARPIRFSQLYGPEGTNVNFVKITDDGLSVRTYERGVEDETFSCGTGVTASAIASVASGKIGSPDINIKAKGGNLNVKFIFTGDGAKEIHLTGPATYVFSGEIEVKDDIFNK